jgi:hypothetical protein
MKADLVLLIFAISAILIAGAAVHGGRGKRPPNS